MASNVPSNINFDFESKIPESSGRRFSGGSVGDSRAANVPNPDACIADAEDDDDPLENHGLVDMQEFGRVTARVDALEGTLRNVNTRGITVCKFSISRAFMAYVKNPLSVNFS